MVSPDDMLWVRAGRGPMGLPARCRPEACNARTVQDPVDRYVADNPPLYRHRACWCTISVPASPRSRRAVPCRHRPTSVGEWQRSADIGRKKATTRRLVWPSVKWQRHGHSLRTARISHGRPISPPIRKAPNARRPVRQTRGAVIALGEAARPRIFGSSRTFGRGRDARRSAHLASTESRCDRG